MGVTKYFIRLLHLVNSWLLTVQAMILIRMDYPLKFARDFG